MKTQLVIALILATATAMAERGEKKEGEALGGGFIQHLDTDGDGKVSSDEFDGPEEHFTKMDQNGDGFIDENEAPTGPPPEGQEEQGEKKKKPKGNKDQSGGGDFVTRLDTDGDGQVSDDEFDGPSDHFSHFDKDGDGFISSEEAPTGPPPRKGGEGGTGGGRR